MEASLRFLFIHGSYHGAWCWRDVLDICKRRNIEARAITLPGNHPRESASGGWGISLERYADAVISAAEVMGGQVTLVGHSFGGMSLTAAAERRPDLFAGLVYVSAILPGPLRSHWRSMRELMRLTGPLKQRLDVIAGKSHLSRQESAANNEVFYNDCSVDHVNYAAANLCAQPLRPMLGNPAPTMASWGRVPRAYIRCEKDNTLPLQLQDYFISTAPDVTVKSLASGHSPFFSMPERLIDELMGIADQHFLQRK